MKSRKIRPPSENEWEKLPIDVQIYIDIVIFLVVDLPKLLWRVDLWLFPPAIFYLTFTLSKENVPADHPMAIWAILAISFMATTLTLFMLRRPKSAFNMIGNHK
jgi:hypothetical protein